MCEPIIEHQLVLFEHQVALAVLLKPSELVLTEGFTSSMESSKKRILVKGKEFVNSELCRVVDEIIKDAFSIQSTTLFEVLNCR